MSYIKKPRVDYLKQTTNGIGLTRRDYEGGMSTLCAGCGHDSITAALVQAYFELDIAPQDVIKLSGIGCSSKTPAYFLNGAHGFNSVHGRMPSVATGAIAANKNLFCIGVSGDGDSLSIGLGQFGHVVRRNLNMLYVIENNGVYGLTKGQFSASADVGSKAKKGEENRQPPIDPVIYAIAMGGSFVARSFSGDKEQLVDLLKAGIRHQGTAIIDVISPCVTFNDHVGSTKSYAHTREYYHPAIHTDFVPPSEEIRAAYDEGEVMNVELHDGSHILLRKTDSKYDPSHRPTTIAHLEDHSDRGEIVTGLLYIDQDQKDLHDLSNTPATPLTRLDHGSLCPGSDALSELMSKYR